MMRGVIMNGEQIRDVYRACGGMLLYNRWVGMIVGRPHSDLIYNPRPRSLSFVSPLSQLARGLT